jgi:two-component system, LuxR family, response regulator FixJ
MMTVKGGNVATLTEIVDRLLALAIEDEPPSFRALAAHAGLNPAHDFIGASLRNLDLRDEDLRGFNFSNADLSGSDFRRANLAGATFDDAILDGVVGLQPEPGARPTLSNPLGTSGKTRLRESIATNGEIFVADSDPRTRDALNLCFTRSGYKVRTFDDGASCLDAAWAETPACIILEVDMPPFSGVHILKALGGRQYPAPIIMTYWQFDYQIAVDIIREGAFDVVEKFDSEIVVARAREAIAWASGGEYHGFPGRDLLTPRELEVLGKIAEGADDKEAGRLLGISPWTIRRHRARIMKKLGAKNAADLLRIVLS